MDELEEGFVVLDKGFFEDFDFEDGGVDFWSGFECGWGDYCYELWFSEILDVDRQDV